MIAHDKVAFISANIHFLQRALGNPTKRQKFERVVDRYGFDHLINLIGIEDDGVMLA